jgi:hypothetical protein
MSDSGARRQFFQHERVVGRTHSLSSSCGDAGGDFSARPSVITVTFSEG